MNIFAGYLFVYLTVAVAALWPNCQQSNSLSRAMSPFWIVLLSAFAALRQGGIDYQGYYNIFEKAPSLRNFFSFEWQGQVHGEVGFIFINSLLGAGGFQLVLFFICALSLSAVFYGSFKLSPYPALSIFIYLAWYFPSMFSIVRTAAVSAIFIFLLYSIVYRKYLLSFFVVIFQVSIHKVSFFITAIMPFSGRKNLISISVFMLFCSFMIYFSMDFEAIFLLTQKFGGSIFDHLYNLYSDPRWSGKSSLFGFVFFKSIFLVLIYLCIRFFHKNIFNGDLFLFFSVFSLVLLVVLSDFYILSVRSYELISTVNILLIPVILLHFRSGSRWFLKVSIVIAYFILFFVKFSAMPDQALTV